MTGREDQHEAHKIAFSEPDTLDAQSPVPSAHPYNIQGLAHISGVRTTTSLSANLEDAIEGSWEDSRDLDMEQDIDLSYSDFEAGLHDCLNDFDDVMLSQGKYHPALEVRRLQNCLF
jgi:hypothetical protein